MALRGSTRGKRDAKPVLTGNDLMVALPFALFALYVWRGGLDDYVSTQAQADAQVAGDAAASLRSHMHSGHPVQQPPSVVHAAEELPEPELPPPIVAQQPAQQRRLPVEPVAPEPARPAPAVEAPRVEPPAPAAKAKVEAAKPPSPSPKRERPSPPSRPVIEAPASLPALPADAPKEPETPKGQVRGGGWWVVGMSLLPA